jgi:hypothetical protein
MLGFPTGFEYTWTAPRKERTESRRRPGIFCHDSGLDTRYAGIHNQSAQEKTEMTHPNRERAFSVLSQQEIPKK